MSTGRNTLFSGILIAVTSVAISLVIAARLDLVSSPAAQTVTTSPRPARPAINSAPITGQLGANTFRDIAEAQTPMVVNIRTESRARSRELTRFFGGDELFRRFFGDPPEQGRRPPEENGERSAPPTVAAGTGFVIDHIHYYADALKPWIARRDRLPAFLIRRDPRDISRIWVLEPEGQHYLEIPYRTLSHPAVTLWEQRQALAKLRQQGREQVDESALFRMIGQMREIVSTAQKATRKARRDADRRQHLKATAVLFKTTPPPDADMADPQADNQPPAKPFDQIEEW